MAVDAVRAWLEANRLPETAIVCCFGAEDFELYRAQLASDAG